MNNEGRRRIFNRVEIDVRSAIVSLLLRVLAEHLERCVLSPPVVADVYCNSFG